MVIRVSTNIDYYNYQIDSLDGTKQQLVDLSNSLNNELIPTLNEAEGSLNDAIRLVCDNFSINGEAVDNHSIENNKDRVSSIISTITNTVIPSINKKISEINQSIDYYNSLIEEESETEANDEDSN